MQILSRKIGTLQSSFTRAINIQEGKVGPLFQAKFKAIELTYNHAITCFHYIHQNPVKAGLCDKLEGWKYSSYNEYLEKSPWQICDKVKAFEYLGIPLETPEFEIESKNVIVNEKIIQVLTKNHG